MSVYELLACLYVGLTTPRAYLLNYTYISDFRQFFLRFSDCGSVLLCRCCDTYFHCVHQFANSSSVQFMCCEKNLYANLATDRRSIDTSQAIRQALGNAGDCNPAAV